MASTGTPSIFLHPVEAFHGDLGMVHPDDVIFALSFSGETDEVLKLIQPGSNLKEIIDTMSRGKLGLALVNEDRKTIGIITDGDLRRLLEAKGKDAFDIVASNAMTLSPHTIKLNASLVEAEKLFNRFKINSLIVVSEQGETIGVVQIYDL